MTIDNITIGLKSITFRIDVWKSFFRGTISLPQALNMMLLHGMRSKKDAWVKLFGHPFHVLAGEMTLYVVLTEQIIEKNQYHVELIPDNASVIDAGANVGIFSIFAAVNHPDATIYAFEPAPETFAALRENTKYYPNIRVFNCALGDRTGTASLVITPNQGAGNHIGKEGIPVDMKTIDSLGVRMDFLKMDTEGYESPILQGATETIKKWKPIIVMSAYHKPNDKKELPELLNSISSYDCELRHDSSDEDFICKPQ